MRVPLMALPVVIALSLAGANPAGAQVVFLQNDSFTGGALSCFTGIGDNEAVAAKFTAAAGQYPYTIERVRVFGCGGGQDAYIVEIYQDNGSSATPGPLIWSSDNAYFLTGANVFNDILMSQEPVPPPPITSGSIRVSLVTISILAPIGFGADMNGIIPARNFLQDAGGTWSFAESPPNNVTGDWILRLGIVAPGAQPTMGILDAIVAEGSSGTTSATFTVTLSPASSQTVTAQFATADETATAPSDYQARSGTVTFAPGDTLETLVVSVNGDLLNEADETFLVNLTNPVGATIEDSEGRGTITNDDPLPSLAVSDVTVGEGDAGTAAANFTVALSAPSGRTVTVAYATADGTAVAPVDYASTGGTLTFTPPATTQPVSVTVNGDSLDELFESFTLNLSGPTNAVLGDAQAQGVIADDEVPGADFNADGSTDILWRHQGSGQNVTWLMNGVSLASGTFTTPPVLADPSWKIAGTSDFNQDEKTDILWRHVVSGENVIWHMNGTVLASGTFTNPSTLADPGWRIGATGDFDGDGKPDILWHHAVSGQLVVWFMDDFTMTSGTLTTPPALADTAWQVGATGDFNRDGKADVLWHHQGSGQIVVWHMNGALLVTGTFTTPDSLADTNWKIVGAGDFNLDTKVDILWRHGASGQIVVWYMDGVTLISGTFTDPSAFPDVTWQIVGPR
jgi:hypothetical protein